MKTERTSPAWLPSLTLFVSALAAVAYAGCAAITIEPTTAAYNATAPVCARLIVSDLELGPGAKSVWDEFAGAPLLGAVERAMESSGIARSVIIQRDLVATTQPQGTWYARLEVRRAEGGRHRWDDLTATVRVRLYDVSGMTPTSVVDPATGDTTLAIDVAAVEPNRQGNIELTLHSNPGKAVDSNARRDEYEAQIGSELANQLVTGLAAEMDRRAN